MELLLPPGRKKGLDVNKLEAVAHQRLLPSTSMRTLRAVLGDVDPDLAVRFCSTRHHNSVPGCSMRLVDIQLDPAPELL